MNKCKYNFLLIFFLSVSFHYGFAQLPNTWTQKADFFTIGQYTGTGFSIGNEGYMGLGYTPYLFRYNAQSNSWIPTNNVNLVSAMIERSCVINGKGYVLTTQNDLSVYDPTTTAWTQKATCPGSAREGNLFFSIGTKAYMGLGVYKTFVPPSSTTLDDVWEYDAMTDVWTQKNNFQPKEIAAAFSINNTGYILEKNVASNNFYSYNPTTDTWTLLGTFAGGDRGNSGCFVIGNKAYLTLGFSAGTYVTDLWEYNPANNSWTAKAAFPDPNGRGNPCAFSIGGKGYIGLGNDMMNVTSNFSSAIYEYTPDVSTDIADGFLQDIQLFPHPCNKFLHLQSSLFETESIDIRILNSIGQTLFSDKTEVGSTHFEFNTETLATGTYILQLSGAKGWKSMPLIVE